MKRKTPALDHAEVARRVAAMTLGRVTARRERAAEQAKLLAGLAEMDLEELRRHSTTRQWLCAAAHASGATGPEIARILGLKGGEVSAHRLRKHPIVARLVELIQQHQLQLVLHGQYGTTAQARAAAPEVMSHLSELAGAQRERDGTRRGRAARDRDAIAAGLAVLDVAGARRQQQAQLHIHHHIFEAMTDAELEAFSNTGIWPDRVRPMLGAPLDLTPTPTLPDPEVNGPAFPTNGRPRTGRGGRVG
jgi:hypothetical protein